MYHIEYEVIDFKKGAKSFLKFEEQKLTDKHFKPLKINYSQQIVGLLMDKVG